MVVDEELTLPHLDPIAGQTDDALDPGLRAVARPAEHHHVAALRCTAKQPPGFRQRDLYRQRGGAVAIGIFRRQQRVADQKRRLHRAGRYIERLGDGALGEKNDQYDPPVAAPARPSWISCWLTIYRRSSAGSSDSDTLHPQRRLADANRHALAVLAAGADA